MTERTVTIYGASDDLVEVEDPLGLLEEEYNTSGNWSALLQDAETGESAIVYVDYRKDGIWTVSLGLSDEGETLPSWAARIAYKHSYSVSLKLDIPDSVKLTEISS